MSLINNKGRWSYKDDDVEENGVDIFVDGDEWVATTYPSHISPSIQRIRAAQLVNYANNYESLEQENTTLRNQIASLQEQTLALREALEECAHMLDVIYSIPLDGGKCIKFMEDSPCHKDIGAAKGLARKALEQTEDK